MLTVKEGALITVLARMNTQNLLSLILNNWNDLLKVKYVNVKVVTS